MVSGDKLNKKAIKGRKNPFYRKIKLNFD